MARKGAPCRRFLINMAFINIRMEPHMCAEYGTRRTGAGSCGRSAPPGSGQGSGRPEPVALSVPSLPPTSRRRFLALLCAAWPGAEPRAAQAVELSAEAIELIGQEGELARRLAQARRRLARTQRDLAQARSPEVIAKLEQARAALEPQIRQMEAQQRLQLPPRQVRGLPVAALKAYVARVRRGLERQGDGQVPQEDGRPLYGSTDIAFTLRSDGSLAQLQVQRAVPRALGLQTALLLQQWAPFEPFPRNVAAKVERISFVRTFRFDAAGEPIYQLRSRPATRPASAPAL